MTWGAERFRHRGSSSACFFPALLLPCYDIGPWGRQKQELQKKKEKQKEEKATVPRREGRGARRASVERGERSGGEGERGVCKWYYVESKSVRVSCRNALARRLLFTFDGTLPLFCLSRREARCDVTEGEGPSGHFLFLILGGRRPTCTDDDDELVL